MNWIENDSYAGPEKIRLANSRKSNEVISEWSFEFSCGDNSVRGVTSPGSTGRFVRSNSYESHMAVRVIGPGIENERKSFDSNNTPFFHFQSSARNAKRYDHFFVLMMVARVPQYP